MTDKRQFVPLSRTDLSSFSTKQLKGLETNVSRLLALQRNRLLALHPENIKESELSESTGRLRRELSDAVGILATALVTVYGRILDKEPDLTADEREKLKEKHKREVGVDEKRKVYIFSGPEDGKKVTGMEVQLQEAAIPAKWVRLYQVSKEVIAPTAESVVIKNVETKRKQKKEVRKKSKNLTMIVRPTEDATESVTFKLNGRRIGVGDSRLSPTERKFLEHLIKASQNKKIAERRVANDKLAILLSNLKHRGADLDAKRVRKTIESLRKKTGLNFIAAKKGYRLDDNDCNIIVKSDSNGRKTEAERHQRIGNMMLVAIHELAKHGPDADLKKSIEKFNNKRISLSIFFQSTAIGLVTYLDGLFAKKLKPEEEFSTLDAEVASDIFSYMVSNNIDSLQDFYRHIAGKLGANVNLPKKSVSLSRLPREVLLKRSQVLGRLSQVVGGLHSEQRRFIESQLTGEEAAVLGIVISMMTAKVNGHADYPQLSDETWVALKPESVYDESNFIGQVNRVLQKIRVKMDNTTSSDFHQLVSMTDPNLKGTVGLYKYLASFNERQIQILGEYIYLDEGLIYDRMGWPRPAIYNDVGGQEIHQAIIDFKKLYGTTLHGFIQTVLERIFAGDKGFMLPSQVGQTMYHNFERMQKIFPEIKPEILELALDHEFIKGPDGAKIKNVFSFQDLIILLVLSKANIPPDKEKSFAKLLRGRDRSTINRIYQHVLHEFIEKNRQTFQAS